MVLDVSDSSPTSDSGELFVDPDLERIRKKNVQAEAKRATHKHVKTQQNKWKALFGGNFQLRRLLSTANLLLTFPRLSRIIRTQRRLNKFELSSNNFFFKSEVVPWNLLYLSSVRTMTIFDSSWLSSNPTLDVSPHLVMPLRLSAASCVRAT